MKYPAKARTKPLSARPPLVHGGNVKELCARFGIQENSVMDFSSNVNPFPLPRSVLEALHSCTRKLSAYPDRECLDLRKALAEDLQVDADHLAPGNGVCDLLYRIVYTLKPDSGLVLCPSFMEYEKALGDSGAKIRRLFLKEKDDFSFSAEAIAEKAIGTDLVFLCNPNNPTGNLLDRKKVLELAEILKPRKTVLVVDEAFIDLAPEESVADRAADHSSLIVLRSMTKFFGLAGLRLGYAIGPLGLIRRLRSCGQPWPVNLPAQKAGEAVIRDNAFRSKSRQALLKELDFLYRNLGRIKGIKPFASRTHYLLVKIENGFSAAKIQKELLKRNLLVRDCTSFRGLNEKFFRAAVKTRRENRTLIRELGDIFGTEIGPRNA